MQLPILRAIASQLSSCGAVWLFASIAIRLDVSISLFVGAALQSVVAAVVGFLIGLRRWWIVVNLLFGPALLLLIRLDVPPWLCLSTLVVLLMFYSNSVASGVPLYLSGNATLSQIQERLSRFKPSFRFVDLGCGFGSALSFLSPRFTGCSFEGIENAPLVYLVAKLRSILHGNLRVRFGSIWKVHWGDYDVVYCFLSPVPMPDVWKKARSEMKPGSLLISNTFEIPGVPPHETIEMRDWRGSKIFIWRI